LRVVPLRPARELARGRLRAPRREAVEVDGGYHARRASADGRRDRKLARMGYRVLRVEAELIEQQLDEAVARVRAALTR
jgi:very-short-patch-repair endonuclease